MANTRFKGANASERLTLSTLSDSDMFQTRHLPGTVNDTDKGVSKALLQALPVAVCATAAATAAKVGTLAPESCPDFTLVNGRVIHVYFSAANTASVPTINVAGTGAIPITYPNGDYVGAWAAGTTMDLMYISITVDNTAIERWVVVSSLPVDEVAADNMHSVTSNAVAAALSDLKLKVVAENLTIVDGSSISLTFPGDYQYLIVVSTTPYFVFTDVIPKAFLDIANQFVSFHTTDQGFQIVEYVLYKTGTINISRVRQNNTANTGNMYVYYVN